MGSEDIIVGVWVNEIQFRMTNTRTRTVRMLFLPQGNALDPHEREDMVAAGMELFRDELGERPDHQVMPISQQHEFGPHLRAIEATNRRFRETGNRRYH